MGKYDGYHTALAPEPFRLDPLDRAVFDDGLAFQHDIFNGLPIEYYGCAALYSELPWRKGFDVFEGRAGVKGRSYNDFLDAVRSAVRFLAVPTVIITGAHAVKRLQPDRAVETRLNGEKMLALCWNISPPESEDCKDVLWLMANACASIGDFCCGYGRTARFAREAGARFVVSDYNGSCIRYVAETMGNDMNIAA